MSEKISEELIELYRQHIPGYITDLEKAVSDRDKVKMRDVAHNIASAMGSIDDMESGDLFRRIEKEDLSFGEVADLLKQASAIARNTLDGL
jgi:hypothetical protein